MIQSPNLEGLAIYSKAKLASQTRRRRDVLLSRIAQTRNVAIAMTINQCPTCGSDRIRKVHRKWTGVFQGQTYNVEGLEFYECPVCGERVFGREAIRKIEAQSAAFSGSREIKKTA